jgi:hypothetical protein
MKTGGRENPNHGVALPRNRAPGAGSQNKSRSSEWAEKQEKVQPKEMCFFLTFSLYRTNQELRFEPPGPEPESKSYLLKFASSRWLPLKGIVPLPLKPIEPG